MTESATDLLLSGFEAEPGVGSTSVILGVVECTPEGAITRCSEQVQELLGDAQFLATLVPEAEREIMALPERAASTLSVSLRRSGRDHDLVFARLRGVGGVLVAERRAVGGREGVETQLRAVARALGDLGHEINNPLTGIVAALDTALDFEMLSAETTELLSAARAETLRIAELVRRARDATSTATLHVESCDVTATIYEVLRALRLELARDHQTLDLGTLDGGGEFRADITALKAITLNLVLNGRDAARYGGSRVGVRTRVVSGTRRSLEIEVTNDGAGMSPSTALRAGEPLFTTKRSGSGIGLTVVRRMLANAGGLLVLDSGVKAGTLARVVLPEQ